MSQKIIDPRERADKIRDYIENGWALCNHAVPSLAGLAGYLGIGRPRLIAWCMDDEELAELVEGMQAVQECMLVSGGLYKTMDASIVKLMLGKHGYSSQATVEHSGTMKTITAIRIIAGDGSNSPATT